MLLDEEFFELWAYYMISQMLTLIQRTKRHSVTYSLSKTYKLRRFPLRVAALIVGPVVVLAYYAFIWHLVVARAEDTLKLGIPNELWIHYCWFFVGVFGLNFSKYGLLGVKASILHDRNWQVKSAMKLLMHCNSAWSGPGGWFKCGRRRTLQGGYGTRWLNLFPFVALPLSGLTMEPVDGYVASHESPLAIGHKPNDLNRRPKPSKETVLWRTGECTYKWEGMGFAHRMQLPIVKSFSEFAILSQRPTTDFNETSSLTELTLNSSQLSDKIIIAANSNVQLGSSRPDRLQFFRALTHIAPPIGVRCIRDSNIGHADVDRKGYLHSFIKSPPPRVDSHESGDVFGFGYIGYDIAGKFTELLTSTNSPPPLRFTHGLYYPSYIQAETLYQSIMLAHAWNALDLMYDSGYTFQTTYILPNATGSRANKVMGPGAIPPVYVGVLFTLWTIGSVILGCDYGLRRRWSERLDGYSMFRFGADFAREIQNEPDFACTAEFEECQALWKLPGLVSDAEPQRDIDHISLVKRGNEPKRGKRYH
ncbi:hypothetical protein ACJ73_07762 [Blastomyces percursus]|uniref:Uncharacterized protein n=1 Tax=Blastomyces percursus TaxID=1658174 RepID=A0A1J9QYI0_9EURO|nr:hypothetical protein ACJ73_07762 [Blastomyces percursus]